VRDAITGGFFVLETGAPLGELRVEGRRAPTVPFASPWHDVRACVHVEAGAVTFARRHELATDPGGDLLQAGPLLVRDGVPCVEGDPEGFSAASHQFLSDITDGRHPRAALGLDAHGTLLAVVSDGRSPADAGLTLSELVGLMLELGAVSAINLDGGGSAALVCDGELRNTPRDDQGIIPGGRPIVTALVFEHRRDPRWC
jgi:hypothetical protein